MCGALSALCTAITSDAVRPAFQIAANPSALISKGLPRAWRASGAWSTCAERTLTPSTRDQQRASARRLAAAANWLHESSIVPFKVFGLSLVCAAIGPAVAVVIFVLANNDGMNRPKFCREASVQLRPGYPWLLISGYFVAMFLSRVGECKLGEVSGRKCNARYATDYVSNRTIAD